MILNGILLIVLNIVDTNKTYLYNGQTSNSYFIKLMMLVSLNINTNDFYK
jgi:uncharacterized membrane protein